MDINKEMKKLSLHKTDFCPYRKGDGVWCDEYSFCWECGWNPEVERERKKKLRRIYRKDVLECPIRCVK